MSESKQSKVVHLGLPIDMHRQFRIEAGRTGQPMSVLARQLVEEFLGRQGGEGK